MIPTLHVLRISNLYPAIFISDLSKSLFSTAITTGRSSRSKKKKTKCWQVLVFYLLGA